MFLKNNYKRANITRRAIVLSLLMTVPFVFIFSRLYFLQIISAKRYKRLSDNNSLSNKVVLPHRGKILDKTGQVIAFNERVFRLNIIPEQSENIDDVLERINKLIGLQDYEIKKIKQDIKESPKFYSIPIKDIISFKDAAIIEFNIPSLPGVYVDVGLERKYPFKDAGAHLLGYVSAVSKENLYKFTDPMFKVPGFKIGKRGLEEYFNPKLIGTSGIKQLEVNATGRSVKQIAEYKAKDGEDVSITLDYHIQNLVKTKLKDYAASFVLLNAKNGEVLAAVSNPSFDNNDFVNGINENKWKDLLEDHKRPLLNRALNGQYSPASTFKMIVALTALCEKEVTKDFKVTCTGQIKLGRRFFHCWKEHGHGTLDMKQAIASSCDIYFYELGKRLGIDKIAKYAKIFGLGESLDFELFNNKGIVPTTLWKRIRTKTKWQGGDDLVAAIGQGYLLATPLQLAVMAARLGTGKKVNPTIKNNQNLKFENLEIDKESLKTVQEGMDMVVNDYHYGTAFYHRSKKYRIWGKTGTAQVISKRVDTKKVKMEDIPYEERNNGLYVAFFDDKETPLALSIVLEHGGSGSKASGIANKLLEEIIPIVEEYKKNNSNKNTTNINVEQK
jgi:penicillin-binding protein 2